MVHAVVEPTDVVIHPPEDEFVVVDGGGRAKFAFAGTGFLLTAVGPGADDGTCAGIFFGAAGSEEAVEIGRGTVGAVGFVIPSREVQDRRMDSVIFIAELGPVPPGVGGGMREPFVVEGSDVLQVRKVAEGKKFLQAPMFLFPSGCRFLAGFRAAEIPPPTDVGGDIEPDPVEPGAVKGAAGVEKIAWRRKRHSRGHYFQVGRVFGGGKPLDCAGIGEAKGAHAAVGPGLLRDPFDSVVAVVPLIPVGIEFAVGSIAAADVLDNDGIAACDGFFEGFVIAKRRFLAVGRSIDERWEAPGLGGEQNISAENYTVAHGNWNIF